MTAAAEPAAATGAPSLASALGALRGPAAVTLAILVLWQLAHELAGDVAITAPAPTLAHLAEMIGQARFLPHLAETAAAFAQALLIAWTGGVLIGLGLGGSRLAGEAAEPVLVTLYSIPKVTLYPVILLLFGLGMQAKVAFGAFHGIIPVALFTLNAVRNIPAVQIRAARALRLSPAQRARHVLLPAALPEVFAGLRLGFSLTLLGSMLGELFASQRGLGFLLMKAIDLHDVETILAIAVLISVFAVAANMGLLAIDRRLRRGAAPAGHGA